MTRQSFRQSWFLVMCVVLVFGGGVLRFDVEVAVAMEPLRRVILISCDTLAAQHLQAYGSETATTFTFDGLAADGVLFRHCLTPQGWTLSAHISVLTGLNPGVHRVGKYQGLSPAIPLVTELLQRDRFRTAFFATANEWLRPRYGFDRGSDHYRMFRLQDPVVQQATAWVDSNLGQGGVDADPPAFFLFFHFMDVHSRPYKYDFPYLPLQPEAWSLCDFASVATGKQFLPVQKDDLFGEIRNWNLAAYASPFLNCSYNACISAWDNFQLRELLASLQQSGHLTDTLVIITSDHGEEFGEHGGYYHDSPYGEVREVPLLLLWPGRLPAGQVVEARVSLCDLAPTILELAQLPTLSPCQGRSLVPLLTDPAASFPQRDFLIDGNRRGWGLYRAALVAPARDRWWSLIVQTDTTGTTGTYLPERIDYVQALHDLTADPFERLDIQAKYPDLVAELSERLERRLAEDAALARELGSGRPETEVEISDEAARQLRSLGY
ncbi:MAG: sulfatase-like hydrolase/transferase [bacterium]